MNFTTEPVVQPHVSLRRAIKRRIVHAALLGNQLDVATAVAVAALQKTTPSKRHLLADRLERRELKVQIAQDIKFHIAFSARV